MKKVRAVIIWLALGASNLVQLHRARLSPRERQRGDADPLNRRNWIESNQLIMKRL